MTEKEAKAKWCPFVQVAATTTHMGFAKTNNRSNYKSPEAGACIASACMAWRWNGEPGSATGSGLCGLAGPAQ